MQDAVGQQDVAVILPAGAADCYVSIYRVGDATLEELAAPALVAGPEQALEAAGEALVVAVDLESAIVPEDAHRRGRESLEGLAASLAGLGAQRLARGESDDVETLVPAYVAMPRGIAQAAEEMVWSPDPR